MGGSVKLRKGLGLVHVFTIASGAMISSGLFILPGMAHAMAGPGVIWSYVLAGLLATTGALSMAELATAMPKAGGDYFFVMRGFGAGMGSIAGMLSWFALSLKSAFAIVGMSTFVHLILDLPGLLSGAALTVLFIGLNILGVRAAARAQAILVFGLFSLLILYVIAGLPQTRAELLIPFAPYGVGSIFSTAGFVFVSYGGLLKMASVAEEIQNPGRVLPIGLTLALVSVTLLYALAVTVTSGVVESSALDGSLTPLSDGGRMIMGEPGFVAMSIGAILAFISTANAGIMAASRYLLALSRDRLLPSALAKVNARFHTPHIAILITGTAILLSLLLKLNILVEAASCVLILTYTLSCLAVIVLRESGLQNYRPAFKSPLYPWLQIGGILGLAFVLFELGMEAFIISAGLILTAFLTFWFYGRKQSARESALLHLIARLTDRQLVHGVLEAELKQIIRERDEIVVDRFDKLVENAVILDVSEPLTKEQFFEAAAERLAPRLNVTADRLASVLRRREEETSTVLSAFLAVPHMVVPGEQNFDLLIARARKGIDFSSDAREIHAVFILAGTADERNFHLKALSAIAQVVQEEQFEERWLAANDEQALRDIILLAARKRLEPV
ncbi:amino acid permease [Methylohalobius crimeensis]|uniref:amino acid permease n=1 Tax=Methylohalobius crimeensis TaxID=244365 RepID=UPI0003B38303|nr:amino acid permease [Methylohalobius crimeensis]